MMPDKARIRFAPAGTASYRLFVVNLEEIKRAIEKLPREQFFELDRRLSARYPELRQEEMPHNKVREVDDAAGIRKK